MIRSSLGAPRKYSLFATRTTWFLGDQLSKTKGPVPIGSVAYRSPSFSIALRLTTNPWL